MLNPTDEKFLQALLRGATPKEAAIAAGLSEKSARVAGARMRKKKVIVDALAVIGIATPGSTPTVPSAIPSESEAEEVADIGLPQTEDSLEFLEAVVANPNIPLGRRLEAAKTLLPFQHSKIGEKGKKATKADSAKETAAGSDAYATRKPPALKAVPN
jgi:phage terminase small subunit